MKGSIVSSCRRKDKGLLLREGLLYNREPKEVERVQVYTNKIRKFYMIKNDRETIHLRVYVLVNHGYTFNQLHY